MALGSLTSPYNSYEKGVKYLHSQGLSKIALPSYQAIVVENKSNEEGFIT
jgi:hypothetical protein